MKMAVYICVTALMIISAPLYAADGDAKKGERVFKKCKVCHSLGQDETNTLTAIGPDLAGIIGRPAASVEGFDYSQALKDKAEAGLVWDEQTLTEFLAKPSEYLPGTKMVYPGLRKERHIRNLLAYLAQFSE